VSDRRSRIGSCEAGVDEVGCEARGAELGYSCERADYRG